MNDIFRNFMVNVMGITVMILTVIIISIISVQFNLNILTFSVWFIIPVGAIITGMLASAGYFGGSLFLHIPTTGKLLLRMVVVAGLTPVAIYYAEYLMSPFSSFGDYLNHLFSHSYVRFGRALQHRSFTPMGMLGYWLMLIQFIGAVLGGASMYAMLLESDDNPSK